MFKLQNLSLVILSVFIFSFSVKADSWALPEERTVCSENDKFCFKIIPK